MDYVNIYDQAPRDHIDNTPYLQASTAVNRPIVVTIQGKNITIGKHEVSTLFGLFDYSVMALNNDLGLYGARAKMGSFEGELIDLVDSEFLPRECQNFRVSPRVDSGSTTGGHAKKIDGSELNVRPVILQQATPKQLKRYEDKTSKLLAI